MSLTTPKIDYIGIRDEIITFLRTNVVSLNVGLSTAFTDVNTQIIKGFIYQNPSFYYPMIMIDTVNKEEEPLHTLGARREATIAFDIYGVVSEISEGGYDDNDEAVILMSNIEGLFRDNITFSSTKVLLSRMPTTDFKLGNVGASDEGIYVAGGILRLEIDVEVI